VADQDRGDDLVGKVGRVTVPIPVGRPGEIVVVVRGGSESFAAWADEPVAKHQSVVVVESRSARSVVVTPFPELDAL
jgi:membrane protein implicated in regulation of membrane protease activity